MNFTQRRTVDLVVAGRAGIDLNTAQAGCDFAHIPSFTKSVGGSPANIAQGAARLGLKTGFIGKVARDGMGAYIVETFESAGIDVSGIVYDGTGARNCLAVTEIRSAAQSGGYRTEGGFHHGTYLYRAGTADMLLEPDEVDRGLIARAKAVLLSGTAFAQSPSREAMLEILRCARACGTLCVLDLDYRPFGWDSPAQTARVYGQAVAQCDIVIGNREEFDACEYLTIPENRDNGVSARALLGRGVRLVIAKDGPRGSCGYPAGGRPVRRGAIPTEAVKTFGSGDAYAAGLLYGLLTGRTLADSMELGTAAASLALTGISCAESMPSLDAVRAHWEANRWRWEADADERD